MNRFYACLASCILVALNAPSVNAEDTWQRIYTIINTNCTAQSGCHGDTTKPIFNADTTADVLYDLLYNVPPVNPYADTVAEFLLIDPGSLRTSFLFRKIAQCPVGSLEMAPEEGESMPNIEDNQGNPIKLPDSTIELVGAWILAGAPETGVIPVDTIAGNVCAMFVSAKPLPAQDISFTVTPNPASDDFAVSYVLNNTATVSIEAFDTKGAKTTLLAGSFRNAGAHKENISERLADGVYFIRLTVDGRQYQKKLVVY